MKLRELAQRGAPRVAGLGGWPEHISTASLTSRIPDRDHTAPGFDAGLACALDLIPRERQRLAAILHAAYTPEAVAQVRAEAERMDPDSEACWWLAACSVCEEGKLTEKQFLQQLERFKGLIADPAVRRRAAHAELEQMLATFELRDGVPFAVRDGGMQGAYLAGHELSAMYAQQAEVWFVGTIRPTLGLEDFPWKFPPDPDAADREGKLGRSGPVHGSKQFVKCADADEYRRVIDTVADRFGL